MQLKICKDKTENIPEDQDQNKRIMMKRPQILKSHLSIQEKIQKVKEIIPRTIGQDLNIQEKIRKTNKIKMIRRKGHKIKKEKVKDQGLIRNRNIKTKNLERIRIRKRIIIEIHKEMIFLGNGLSSKRRNMKKEEK